ncbi:muscular LMNA-interacting protein isoform X3 [Parambassis ranga]|uniref:Muscular LMNA-interacting protein isoform X3 n=1 Tax=Parambassis ranga TaxID=210632 RepID=A0A6P7JVU0_9TELE|nr:muscular LMNA-interacting protein isoform X3 [Parambassis ranga]
MDSLNKNVGKVKQSGMDSHLLRECENRANDQVSVKETSKPSIFTFVPVVQKLPIKSIIAEEERTGALTEKADKNVAVSHERVARESMTDGRIFKAERVFIRDSVQGGVGNVMQPETEPHLKPSADHDCLSQIKVSPSVSNQSENTLDHGAARTATMETAVDKHWGISRPQCHDASGHAEVRLGCFANRRSVSEDRTSPTNSADLFPTPASSRDSILSEDKSWSAAQLSSVTSPASFSRTVSPCSSVRSGVFSPAVIQIKRHFLAPGSSLVHIPQTCFSSCESLFSSVCPQSPPPRHRPPLTRLSLLTAILRKGRLPVLSSALQRPYTPCWPVNPVTLSFCNACSAASSVASIPLELSSQFSSSASIDSQSHIQRESNRIITAPLTVQPCKLSRTCPQKVRKDTEQTCSKVAPRWQQVISPPPERSSTLTQTPLPLFCSNFQSVSPAKHEEIDCATFKKMPHTHITKSPELKDSNTHMFLKGHADNNLKKLISPSPKLINEPETSAPQTLSLQPNSSLSRLHSLSQRLRSPPVCPPHLQPSHSCVTIHSPRSDTASPLPRPQNTTMRCELDRDNFNSKSATPSQGFPKAHSLSSPRYTPIVFSGCPSPISSPTPTPSPAPPVRELTLSPSPSLRSTPSPRPGSGISDCSDREGKKRKTHKIKLSYKSLAAIPTNTLLLDQQAIDEQVEREQTPCDTPDGGGTLDEGVADTHAEQNNLSSPKSLGRETKYASLCSLHPSARVERKPVDPKKTKPGVIRPLTAIPRLTVEDEDRFYPNPFRQTVIKQTDKKMVGNVRPEELGIHLHSSSKGETLSEQRNEKKSPFFVCDLQITEPGDQIRKRRFNNFQSY